jgi:hypothetical protein
LHTRKRVWLRNAVVNLAEYHRHASPREIGQYAFGFVIEFDNRAVGQFFLKRMVDDCAGLVMFNPDGGLWTATIARPLDMPSNHVLGALQPLETNDGGSRAFRFAACYAAISEGVEPPLPRRLYVRPVMRPNANGDERTPPDRLLVDVIHQAVRRIKEGDGAQPAVAPSVVVINLSLGDETRPYARTMSPLGRLLDYLSNRYRVLFLASAGNILDRLPVAAFDTSVEFEAATPADREWAILDALNSNKSQRTLLSPAESLNALTIGAAHSGSAFNGNLPNGRIDPFTDEELPNIVSAMGLGFKKIVKPELLFSGGRAPVRVVASGGGIVIAPVTAGVHMFGLKAVRPSPQIGGTRYEDFTFGTSVATALATRGAHQIHDVLMDGNGGSNVLTMPILTPPISQQNLFQ